MKTKMLTLLFGGAAMAVLILDSRAAVQYADEGIQLCIRTVIPSLFPFLMVGMVLTREFPVSRWLRPIGRLFGLPAGAEAILFTGFLGGYPIGAQSTAAAFHAGALTKKQANRMLCFCSQPGPAFLFGILGNVFSPRECWLLWGIILLSAWVVSFVIPTSIHPAATAITISRPDTPVIKKAAAAMAQICAWIILMRIVIGFWDRWFGWMLPEAVQCTVSGFLELTNGCLALQSVSAPQLRFILAAVFLSFGGICVMLQTGSLARGLDMRYYAAGKLLQSAVSLCLATAMFGLYTALIPPIILILCSASGIFRKNSSIPAQLSV